MQLWIIRTLTLAMQRRIEDNVLQQIHIVFHGPSLILLFLLFTQAQGAIGRTCTQLHIRFQSSVCLLKIVGFCIPKRKISIVMNDKNPLKYILCILIQIERDQQVCVSLRLLVLSQNVLICNHGIWYMCIEIFFRVILSRLKCIFFLVQRYARNSR